MSKTKWLKYKAEFEDENFEIFSERNDHDGLETAFNFEKEHGTLFNLFEIDDSYNEKRTIL